MTYHSFAKELILRFDTFSIAGRDYKCIQSVSGSDEENISFLSRLASIPLFIYQMAYDAAKKVAWERRKRQHALENRLHVCRDCDTAFQSKYSLKKHDTSRSCLALMTANPCVPVASPCVPVANPSSEAAASVPAPLTTPSSVPKWFLCCQTCQTKLTEFLDLFPCKDTCLTVRPLLTLSVCVSPTVAPCNANYSQECSMLSDSDLFGLSL